MLDTIINFDQSLFHTINVDMANPATDFIMPIITGLTFWMPLLVAFAVYQVWKGGFHGRVCVIAVLVGVVICDQVNSSIIKELVGRARPCHFLADINLLVPCGAGKSFPSSHAANSMMGITIIAMFFRKHKVWLPLLPIIIGISRVFVGVHFPVDIFAGWIVGVIVGLITYFIVTKLADKIMQKYKQRQTAEQPSNL